MKKINDYLFDLERIYFEVILKEIGVYKNLLPYFVRETRTGLNKRYYLFPFFGMSYLIDFQRKEVTFLYNDGYRYKGGTFRYLYLNNDKGFIDIILQDNIYRVNLENYEVNLLFEVPTWVSGRLFVDERKYLCRWIGSLKIVTLNEILYIKCIRRSYFGISFTNDSFRLVINGNEFKPEGTFLRLIN